MQIGAPSQGGSQGCQHGVPGARDLDRGAAEGFQAGRGAGGWRDQHALRSHLQDHSAAQPGSEGCGDGLGVLAWLPSGV